MEWRGNVPIHGKGKYGDEMLGVVIAPTKYIYSLPY
jgi:hypothetical protein